jgi:hypothetical protein
MHVKRLLRSRFRIASSNGRSSKGRLVWLSSLCIFSVGMGLSIFFSRRRSLRGVIDRVGSLLEREGGTVPDDTQVGIPKRVNLGVCETHRRFARRRQLSPE